MNRKFIGFDINPKYKAKYETKVRSVVQNEWKEIQKGRLHEREIKLNFEKTILKLRALKYARLVSKTFTEKLPKSEGKLLVACVCLAEFSSQKNAGFHIELKVIFLTSGKLANGHTALNKAKARTNEPPLSYFGINSELRVEKLTRFIARASLSNYKTFYVYPLNNTRSFHAKGNPVNLLKKGSQLTKGRVNGKIPLLSNLGVDVNWARQ